MFQVKVKFLHFVASYIQLFEIDLHFLGHWTLNNRKCCDERIIDGGNLSPNINVNFENMMSIYKLYF